MPAPTFVLSVFGSNPVRTSKQRLEDAINAAFLQIYNELTTALVNKADILNSGKIFGNRQAMVDFGQDNLRPIYGSIAVLVAGGIEYRNPQRQGPDDDPLFPTAPYWGVAIRINTAGAVRDAGTMPTVNTRGTGDNIIVDLSQSMLLSGVTSIGTSSEIEYVPLWTNDSANPTIEVQGVTYGIQGADAEGWPAQGFVVGRSYRLRRRNTILRVVSGDVTKSDLMLERAARIRSTAQAGSVTLTNVAGTGDAITAEVPQLLKDDGIVAANIRGIDWQAVNANTGPASLNIDGQGAVGLFTAENLNLTAGFIQPGRMYSAVKLANRWRIMSGGGVSRADYATDMTAQRVLISAAGGYLLTDTSLTTANEIRGSFPTGVTLQQGMRIMFQASAVNTAAVNVTIPGGSTRSLRAEDGSVLAAGELLTGRYYTAMFVGSIWTLLPDSVTRRELVSLQTLASGAYARANHTGTQPISSVRDLQSRLDVMMKAAMPSSADDLAEARKTASSWGVDSDISPDQATVVGGAVMSLASGGIRGYNFVSQDTSNPSITIANGGIQFNNGAWLRAILTASTVGKVVILADITPGATSASAVFSGGGLELSAEPTRLVGKFPGLNLAMETRPDYVGRRQVIGMMADADSGKASVIQRDGFVVTTDRAMSSFNWSDLRIGRSGTYTIHRLWVMVAAPGQPLFLSLQDAWKIMVKDSLQVTKEAWIAWGLGQSLYQGTPVPASNAVSLEETFRRALKRLGGLVRVGTGVAVGATGAGGDVINQGVPASSLEPIPGGSDTILFASSRSRIRKNMGLSIPTPLIIAGTNGLGGQGIREFGDVPVPPPEGSGNTNMWDNNRYWLDQAVALAIAQGYVPRLPYFLVIHGTADKIRPEGWYFGEAVKVFDLHFDHALGIFGYAPKLVMGQSGGDADTSNDGPTGWGLVVDQIKLIRHYSGLLIGPEFAFKIEDDNVHPDWIRRALFSELNHEAQSYYESGLNWNLLWPETAIVQGNVVTLNVDMPHGSNILTVPEPSKYDAYGGFCPNLGFSAPGRNILDVTLSGRSCRVTLDGPPTELRYAMQVQNVMGNRDTDGQSYTAHRGLIATDWMKDSVFFPGTVQRRWMHSYTWRF